MTEAVQKEQVTEGRTNQNVLLKRPGCNEDAGHSPSLAQGQRQARRGRWKKN